MEREAVDSVEAVGADAQLIRAWRVRNRQGNREGDLILGRGRCHSRSGAAAGQRRRGRRAEAAASDRVRTAYVATGVGVVVGLVDREEHRVLDIQFAQAERTELRGRALDRDAVVGGSLVDGMHDPGPGLELSRDGPELRVVVEVAMSQRAGIVTDEAVHVCARARRQRAVVGACRRQQDLVETVDVAVCRELPVAVLVVDAHGNVGGRGNLTQHDAAAIGLHVEVVVDQSVELRWQGHLGVHEEPGRHRATTRDRDQLGVTDRNGAPRVRVATGIVEIRVDRTLAAWRDRGHREGGTGAQGDGSGAEGVPVIPDRRTWRDLEAVATPWSR